MPEAIREKKTETGKKVFSHCGKKKRVSHQNREGRKWGLYTTTSPSTLYFVSLWGIVFWYCLGFVLFSAVGFPHFTSIEKGSKNGENK